MSFVYEGSGVAAERIDHSKDLLTESQIASLALFVYMLVCTQVCVHCVCS